MAKKYKVIERLTWLPRKSCYINLKFFETLKDTPNTSEGFKFVAFVVLTGGPFRPPPPWCLVWVPKPMVPEGLINFPTDFAQHLKPYFSLQIIDLIHQI